MQDVAVQVRMTAPALYHYFDSKQRLLFEVIERSLERYHADLEVALGAVAGSPTAELAAFVRTHLAFQLDRVEGARIYNAMFLGTGALLAALSPGQRAKIMRLQSEIRGRLKAALERGRASGEFAFADVMVTAMGILAMGEFAVSWFRPEGRLTAAEVADQYAGLAVRMVAAGPHDDSTRG